jgi:hypothetical protein
MARNLEASHYFLISVESRDQKHTEWARGFLALLDELKKYVTEHHTTGLAWNPKVRTIYTWPTCTENHVGRRRYPIRECVCSCRRRCTPASTSTSPSSSSTSPSACCCHVCYECSRSICSIRSDQPRRGCYQGVAQGQQGGNDTQKSRSTCIGYRSNRI